MYDCRNSACVRLTGRMLLKFCLPELTKCQAVEITYAHWRLSNSMLLKFSPPEVTQCRIVIFFLPEVTGHGVVEILSVGGYPVSSCRNSVC